MFGKVIVFGLFEMLQKKKKKRVRTASSSPGLTFGSGHIRWCGLSQYQNIT